MDRSVVVPNAGESVSEGEISKWYKSNGDLVEKDEIIADLETEKASLEIRAPMSGRLAIKVEVNSTVNIGDVIANIEDAPPAPSKKKEDSLKKQVPIEPTEKSEKSDEGEEKLATHGSPHAGPSVRKLLREGNIDPASIMPSGRGGRIRNEDFAPQAPSPEVPSSKPIVQGILNEKGKEVSGDRQIHREKMSRIRRTIASRLLSTKNETALLTTFNEVDMSEVIAIRSKYKDQFKEKHQVGLGFNSFFMKAASFALKAFPVVNSKIEGEEVVYANYEDIGIAVATPKGLIVPVVRDVGKKSFIELEKQILDFALRGRENRVTLEEMNGGTFSITNGGVFGSMLSTPIINYPQSAILGLHKISKRPVVVDDEIKIKPIMYVALTYDHRQIDGAQAVQFLVHIKNSIEDPTRLLIGL